MESGRGDLVYFQTTLGSRYTNLLILLPVLNSEALFITFYSSLNSPSFPPLCRREVGGVEREESPPTENPGVRCLDR